MRKWFVVAAALFVVLALVWLLSRGEQQSERARIAVVEQAPRVEPLPAELTPLEAPDKTEARAAAPVTALAETTRSVSATAAADLAEIRGRLLLPSGAAAVGVGIKLSGFTGNQERALRFGAPDDWKDIQVESGSDGSFSIRFDPPRAFQFFMKSSLANYCEASWRWGEIEPKKLVDVGDVTLVRGGSVRGRIVDAKGRALTQGWMVYAEAGSRDFTAGKDQTRVMAPPDSASGEFVLAGVPPGSVHLTAYSRIANWIEGPSVTVRENEESQADIHYTGPDLSNRITVSISTAPFHVFTFGEFDIFLSGTGIEERKAKKVPGSSQSFAFEDVPAGQYHVEIRDPRFEPWSRDGVEPGTALSAKLKGSAALVLAVVDDATSEPVGRYALDIRFEKTNSSPNSFRILEEKSEPPKNGVFGGIVSGEATAIVRVTGYSSCEVPLGALAPNEQRAVTARLVRALSLSGRVVSGPAKTPLAKAKVELTPFKPQPQGGLIRQMQLDPDAKSCESDANGRFSFDGLSMGEFTLRASLNKLLGAETQLTISKTTPLDALELVLPEPAWLVGRVIAPAGVDLTGLKLLAAPMDTRDVKFLLFRGDDVSAPLSSDGSFRVGPVPAGPSKVSVHLPEMKLATSRNGWSSSSGPMIDFGSVELLANVETRRDFDLGENCPGTFTFQVTVDGSATSEYTVHIENSLTHQVAGYVTLDSAGKGQSGPVLPGSYTFTLARSSGNAAYPLNQVSELGPNQTVNVVLPLQLFTGTLRVTDIQSGQPLAGQQIFLTAEMPDARGFVSLQTDAEGRATGQLAVGRYRVATGNPFSESGPDAVFVDWSASGASPAEVRLKKQTRD